MIFFSAASFSDCTSLSRAPVSSLRRLWRLPHYRLPKPRGTSSNGQKALSLFRHLPSPCKRQQRDQEHRQQYPSSKTESHISSYSKGQKQDPTNPTACPAFCAQRFSPHFSRAFYCGDGSGHVYCVALCRAPRRTVEYVCGALGRAPCIHARLRRLATKPREKCGLGVLLVWGHSLIMLS